MPQDERPDLQNTDESQATSSPSASNIEQYIGDRQVGPAILPLIMNAALLILSILILANALCGIFLLSYIALPGILAAGVAWAVGSAVAMYAVSVRTNSDLELARSKEAETEHQSATRALDLDQEAEAIRSIQNHGGGILCYRSGLAALKALPGSLR